MYTRQHININNQKEQADTPIMKQPQNFRISKAYLRNLTNNLLKQAHPSLDNIASDTAYNCKHP